MLEKLGHGSGIFPSGYIEETFMGEVAWVFELGLEWVGFMHEEMGREAERKESHSLGNRKL